MQTPPSRTRWTTGALLLALVILAGITIQVPSALRAPAVQLTPMPTSEPVRRSDSSDKPATLADFWNGKAEWVLDVSDTGLPLGESDTIYMGGSMYWSFLHASTQSAGIVDSCGDPVEFPGCVTRWVSTDGGRHFELPDPQCVLSCDSCPCDSDDHTGQQQYPRVVRDPDGNFYMVYENGASAWLTHSDDGLIWDRAEIVRGTGIWSFVQGPCDEAMRIWPHPAFIHEMDCMSGGPPGLLLADDLLYVFVGLGQNPGHMGCFWANVGLGGDPDFAPCESNPLFNGALEYGPLEARGVDANPYFDFRFVTSAEVVYVDGVYYMTYEGIRGPSNNTLGRDDQFGLGFARSRVIDGPWEKYPGNPVLSDVIDNWGIGHADLVLADEVTYMYAGTPEMVRGRYKLVFSR